MLEKPTLDESALGDCLLTAYHLKIVNLTFLPLGADVNTAVYRADAEDSTAYFVKLRGGAFDPASVALPKFLSEQGIRQIIVPIVTHSGDLWTSFANFTLILYPFLFGSDAYASVLAHRQWYDFGAAMKQLHTVTIPPTIGKHLAQERYSAHARQAMKERLTERRLEWDADEITLELAAFLNQKRETILELVGRSEALAQRLRKQRLPFVLCHSDLHPGNLLLSNDGKLYIVDWDNPIWAPKERDLMFIGGGLGFAGYSPAEERTLFDLGYGEVAINHEAIACYRYERIVQDLAAFCDEILSPHTGGQDRKQALQYLMGNFDSGGTIEIAQLSDKN